MQEATCWEVGGEDVCLVSKGFGSPPEHLHLLGSLPHLHVLRHTVGVNLVGGGRRGVGGGRVALGLQQLSLLLDMLP